MPGFRKILCPVDFDQNSLLALRIASDMAQEQRTGTLDVLHVVPVPAGPEVAIPFGMLEKKAKIRLERLVRHRIDPRIHYAVHITTGDPAGEAIRMAEKTGADLIVMATHGRRGLRRFVLGSVAERVVREAPCAVLTVKSKVGSRAPQPAGAASTRRRANR